MQAIEAEERPLYVLPSSEQIISSSASVVFVLFLQNLKTPDFLTKFPRYTEQKINPPKLSHNSNLIRFTWNEIIIRY